MNKSKISPVLILLIFGFMACKEQKPKETIDLSELTIAAIHKAYQEGAYTSNQLVEAYLQRIEDLDPNINSITTINSKALHVAKALDDERSPLSSLSQREREVLQLVVEGNPSSKIAEVLCLSPKTVETYRSRVMRKLALTELPALVRFAIQHGITPLV